MAVPIALAIEGMIAMVGLAQTVIERYKNGSLSQDEFDKAWHEMNVALTSAVADWQSSKTTVQVADKE